MPSDSVPSSGERENSERTVEKPLGAGRELDALVAERVMGYVWRRSSSTGRRCLYRPDDWPEWMSTPADGSEPLVSDWNMIHFPHYSTDIAAAWRVVEKLEREPSNTRAMLTRRGFVGITYSYTTSDDPEGREYVEGWTCEFRDCAAPWRRVEKGAPTAAFAICRAALALPNARAALPTGEAER